MVNRVWSGEQNYKKLLINDTNNTMTIICINCFIKKRYFQFSTENGGQMTTYNQP